MPLTNPSIASTNVAASSAMRATEGSWPPSARSAVARNRVPPSLTRVVHQDAPHQRCSHREEVRAVAPVHGIDPGQAQVNLVDQGRGLQRVAVALVAHVVVGEAAQFLVNDRHEALSGGGIVIRPIGQKLGDLSPLVGVCFLAHWICPSSHPIAASRTTCGIAALVSPDPHKERLVG